MRLLIILLCTLVVACDKPARVSTEENTVKQSQPVDAVDPNSMEAINLARVERESWVGKAHYDRVCAACHDGEVKSAPHKDMLGLMTPEAVLTAITDGVMASQAASLSDEQKVEVAEYISGAKLGQTLTQLPQCGSKIQFDLNADALANNWGIQPENTRNISTSIGGISSTNVGKLQTKWAIAFPGATRVRSQPTFAGGLVFVGSHGGKVYALDQHSGCVVWSYQAAGEVRTGIVVGSWSDTAPVLYFGDVLGNAYGISAANGEMVWRLRADDHPSATITATPTLFKGMLYISVSSLEVSLPTNPLYECCTFRGSVVAVTALTGERQWKTYTIAEEPRITGQTSIGTNIIGPSGAVVWNSPSIDEKNNQLFIGTGENMSSPASLTSDAIIAMDLANGDVNWVYQATANDVWNGACDTSRPENCPVEGGPDFDFGGATLVIDSSQHGRLVVAGQKSGFVHALDAQTGKLVWKKRVGRGGIQGGIHFGIAANEDTIFVPISDMEDGRTYTEAVRPGMHALDVETGEILWSTIHEDVCNGESFCHAGISQVPTVVGDMVIAGSMDGTARAYAIATGEIVWQLDSRGEFATTLGGTTKGGSMGGGAGPIAFGGMLLLSSGYGLYAHMPGNLFLALEVVQ